MEGGCVAKKPRVEEELSSEEDRDKLERISSSEEPSVTQVYEVSVNSMNRTDVLPRSTQAIIASTCLGISEMIK